jgi:hypothetical protein
MIVKLKSPVIFGFSPPRPKTSYWLGVVNEMPGVKNILIIVNITGGNFNELASERSRGSQLWQKVGGKEVKNSTARKQCIN